MLAEFFTSHKVKINELYSISPSKLNNYLQDYSFLHISDKFNIEDPKEIIDSYLNLQHSKLIVINKSPKFPYFIIGLNKTIIIIHRDKLNWIHQFFIHNPDLLVCFLCDKDF